MNSVSTIIEGKQGVFALEVDLLKRQHHCYHTMATRVTYRK